MIAKSKNNWNPRELIVLTLGHRLYWTWQQGKSGMANKQKINVLLFRTCVISWVAVVSDLFLLHHLNSNCKDSVKSGNFQYDFWTGALTISSLLHWHRYTRFASTMANPSAAILFFDWAKWKQWKRFMNSHCYEFTSQSRPHGCLQLHRLKIVHLIQWRNQRHQKEV